MILYCIEYISRHYAFKLIIVTIPDYTWVEPFLKFFFFGGGGLGVNIMCIKHVGVPLLYYEA